MQNQALQTQEPFTHKSKTLTFKPFIAAVHMCTVEAAPIVGKRELDRHEDVRNFFGFALRLLFACTDACMRRGLKHTSTHTHIRRESSFVLKCYHGKIPTAAALASPASKAASNVSLSLMCWRQHMTETPAETTKYSSTYVKLTHLPPPPTCQSNQGGN